MTNEDIRILLTVYLDTDIPSELIEEIQGFMQIAFEEGFREGYDDCILEHEY